MDFFPIWQTTRRFVYALAVLMMCRIVFWYFNRDLLAYPQLTDFLYGIRFDASVVTYVCGPALLLGLWALVMPVFKRQPEWVRFLFFTGLLMAVTLETVDAAYYRFANRRSLPGDIGLFLNSRSMAGSLALRYSLAICAFFIGCAALIAWYNRLNLKPVARQAPKGLKGGTIGLAAFLLMTGLLVIAARGGLQLRPLTPLGAAGYASRADLIPLVSNTSLNFITSAGATYIEEKHYLSEAEAEKIWPVVARPQPVDSFLPYNVMILTLESFGKEYSALQNLHAGRENLTPFLDSLARNGLWFRNSYANGLRSSQGIVSLVAGLPPLMSEPFMFSPYQSNCLEGLGGALKKKGYQTAFFHGSNPGSMDFDKLAKLTGFDRFYDRYSYPDQSAYDGMWGIFDDPMLQFTANTLDKTAEPFFAFFFSLTSHHPYTVPPAVVARYPELSPLHRAVRYTDDAVRNFFEHAQRQPWFKRTLFVITADHVGAGSPRAEYRSPVGRFAVPVIFYFPGKISPESTEIPVQQIDILPSILDFLQYDQRYLSFGRSVFEPEEISRFIVQYEEGTWQFSDGARFGFFDGTELTGVFDHKNDLECRINILEKDLEASIRLKTTMQSILQQYIGRMQNNTLCPVERNK